jgi:hypothetical protein
MWAQESPGREEHHHARDAQDPCHELGEEARGEEEGDRLDDVPCGHRVDSRLCR